MVISLPRQPPRQQENDWNGRCEDLMCSVLEVLLSRLSGKVHEHLIKETNKEQFPIFLSVSLIKLT